MTDEIVRKRLGRPRKYDTEEERQLAKKEQNKRAQKKHYDLKRKDEMKLFREWKAMRKSTENQSLDV